MLKGNGHMHNKTHIGGKKSQFPTQFSSSYLKNVTRVVLVSQNNGEVVEMVDLLHSSRLCFSADNPLWLVRGSGPDPDVRGHIRHPLA